MITIQEYISSQSNWLTKELTKCIEKNKYPGWVLAELKKREICPPEFTTSSEMESIKTESTEPEPQKSLEADESHFIEPGTVQESSKTGIAKYKYVMQDKKKRIEIHFFTDWIRKSTTTHVFPGGELHLDDYKGELDGWEADEIVEYKNKKYHILAHSKLPSENEVVERFILKKVEA